VFVFSQFSDPSRVLLMRGGSYTFPFYPAGVVFEDAPAGIISGRTAGCTVIAVLTTHDREAVLAARPDYILETLLE
jgi:hypothetical protein